MTGTFKRNLLAILLTPVLAAPLVLPAQAARHDANADTETMRSEARTPDMRASQLIGKEVRNAQGEKLGDIKDLIVDLNNQRVHYAVLEFGGVLGMGDKLFAYPVRAFETSADGKSLRLNVDKERLKQAPGFAKNDWPDWNDVRYRAEVDTYYGDTMTVHPMPNHDLKRASDLIGRKVDDRSGKGVGEIKDLVVNMADGRVRYAVMELDSGPKKDKLAALPLHALTFPSGKRDVVLNIDRSRLAGAYTFEQDKWPDINDRKFTSKMRAHMARIPGVRDVGGVSSAERTGGGAGSSFDSLDRNHDGFLSRSELRRDQALRGDFKRLDTNHDGRISHDEFEHANK